MIGIGIRVYSNTKIYYTIIDRNSQTGELAYLTVDSLIVPLALDKPEQLNFVRNTLFDIITEYRVDRAAIRVAETSGFGGLKQTTLDRLYLEGVIQESIANSSVAKYVAGPISKLASILEERADFKKYAAGVKVFEHAPKELSWQNLSIEVRESVLACYTAVHIN